MSKKAKKGKVAGIDIGDPAKMTVDQRIELVKVTLKERELDQQVAYEKRKQQELKLAEKREKRMQKK